MSNTTKTTKLVRTLFAAGGWIIALLLLFGVIPQFNRSADTRVDVAIHDVGDPATGGSIDEPSQEPATDQELNLINEHYPLAKAGDPGWDYHQTLTADLDGDGREETVHVIAMISRFPGSPDGFAWDDGHVWQVYVEDMDGNVTYLFADWVQLGLLRVVLLDDYGDPDSQGLGFIREQGAGMTLYRVKYTGPGDFQITSAGSLPILREATPIY